MQTIWKYGLDMMYPQHLSMPKGAKILSVQAQQEQPCLWALVNDEADRETRIIYVFDTGHQAVPIGGDLVFLDTFQMADGGLIFHAFEGVNTET